MSEQSYILMLDDLNRMTAQFTWTHPDFDGRSVNLSLPREDWERAGRPGELTITVSA